MKWKLTLPKPEDNGVDYLVMHEDSAETGGTYIYYLSSTKPEVGFDDWFESLENARDVATDYGLSIDDWQCIKSED